MKLVLEIYPNRKDKVYITASLRDSNSAVCKESTIIAHMTEERLVVPNAYDSQRCFMEGFLYACGFFPNEEAKRVAEFARKYEGRAIRVEYAAKSTALANNYFYITAL